MDKSNMKAKDIFKYVEHLEKQNKAIKQCLIARIQYAKKIGKSFETLVVVQKLEEILSHFNEFGENDLFDPSETVALREECIKDLKKLIDKENETNKTGGK